jgi:hypothetical protein
MMHGREKSHPAIVAKKPANNAGQPAAEAPSQRRNVPSSGSANRKRSISLASLISADGPGRSYAGAYYSPSPSKGDG